MFGSIFDKVTGLFDQSFVLGLLLPTFACCAGIGAVAATRLGWSQVASWWQNLDASRQVTAAVVVAAGLIFAATVLGTQVVAMTRALEGYWRWAWADKTLGRKGVAAPTFVQDVRGHHGDGIPTGVPGPYFASVRVGRDRHARIVDDRPHAVSRVLSSLAPQRAASSSAGISGRKWQCVTGVADNPRNRPNPVGALAFAGRLSSLGDQR